MDIVIGKTYTAYDGVNKGKTHRLVRAFKVNSEEKFLLINGERTYSCSCEDLPGMELLVEQSSFLAEYIPQKEQINLFDNVIQPELKLLKS